MGQCAQNFVNIDGAGHAGRRHDVHYRDEQALPRGVSLRHGGRDMKFRVLVVLFAALGLHPGAVAQDEQDGRVLMTWVWGETDNCTLAQTANYFIAAGRDRLGAAAAAVSTNRLDLNARSRLFACLRCTFSDTNAAHTLVWHGGVWAGAPTDRTQEDAILFPILIVSNVPFLLTTRRDIVGHEEEAMHYFQRLTKYCIYRRDAYSRTLQDERPVAEALARMYATCSRPDLLEILGEFGGKGVIVRDLVMALPKEARGESAQETWQKVVDEVMAIRDGTGPAPITGVIP
jgi:hypothetical protein